MINEAAIVQDLLDVNHPHHLEIYNEYIEYLEGEGMTEEEAVEYLEEKGFAKLSG